MSLEIAEHGVVNLTPHGVTVRWGGQERLLPSAGVARLIDIATPVDPVAGLPVVKFPLVRWTASQSRSPRWLTSCRG